MENNQKCGFIALMGAPNVGKSTLVNNLVGSKISIVTPKVQTTRASIKGIYTQGDTQLIFIDTPGLFNAKEKLEKAIVKEAWSGVEAADYLALLIDAKKGICKDTAQVIKSLKEQGKKAALIINKIDLIQREKLFELATKLNDEGVFTETFMVSALKGDGTKKLIEYFGSIAKNSPWMFPEDQIMDAPIKFYAAEVTREKIFMKLQQEIPYSVAVETEKWEETKKAVNIHQVIYVRKQGQKAIILGKGGTMIKQIGASSRRELEEALESKVNLFLFVKVRENWVDNPSIYKEIGLDL
ncbi:MAG: GTPase Era [Rickettsiales bacterium]|nr:GTPase Era [Pseudomonadota bacterium]MDA0966936.1 GTPase Era [Pseudomonadota bacterium]MDG4543855.1 GTPase Era [Rickettsiales bacterium]MDG4546001.1 GTPase Era [Rickettsiales bacterium]MDG4548247.1 GTPase Era [Rickettsiales bacterium]